MSRDKELRDQAILRAITGCDDLEHSPMQIEKDYLIREAMENRREQGFDIPEEWIPVSRSEAEIILWRSQKMLEDLEGERVNRVLEPYPGNEEEDTMAGKEKESTIDMFDGVNNGGTTVVNIGDEVRITISKITKWVPKVKGEIEKSIVVFDVETKAGKKVRLLTGAKAYVWTGKAKEDSRVKDEVVNV